MPKVLLVASQDPSGELAKGALFRSGVERILVTDPLAALATAKLILPNMVVIKGQPPQACEALARQLRASKETRRTAIVASFGVGTAADADALQRAGVSLVISGPIDPALWDDRIEELLSEPRRRETPVAVRFLVWPDAGAEKRPGTALNLSVRGMLLESAGTLALGSTLELLLDLPGGRTDVVGQVVREAGEDGNRRYGVDFIILRGSARASIEGFVAAESPRG